MKAHETSELDAALVEAERINAAACATEQLPSDGDMLLFLSDVKDRTELGKPLWPEITDRIPRVQHDGSFVLPRGVEGMVDLGSLWQCVVTSRCRMSGASATARATLRVLVAYSPRPFAAHGAGVA